MEQGLTLEPQPSLRSTVTYHGNDGIECLTSELPGEIQDKEMLFSAEICHVEKMGRWAFKGWPESITFHLP